MRASPKHIVPALLAFACSEPPSFEPPRSLDYASDADCAACHAYEFEAWTDSHHDLAMQPASAETVLGDFNDVSFVHFGEETHFSRDGERFLVRATGADGQPAEFEVRYTFGVTPLQQYLIEFDGGRLQCLSVAWDTVEKRWFHLYPDEEITHDDPLHWTGRYQRWNQMCAECHSTDLQRGYDLETDTYDTTWHEIDVGCQACHGPGEAHLAWASSADAEAKAKDESKGLLTQLERHGQSAQMDACAPCHSRRSRITERDDPRETFLDRYLPERLHAGFYFPDGQIRDEVYVWGSFAQTKMYAQGVTCTDCHDPHSLELLAPENGLCTQCHTTDAPLDRFPALQAKDYDTAEHHRHIPGEPGSACVDCHMAERTYMVVDPRRDHSFRIPRPDLSDMLGTPDACTDCHAEQGSAWAARAIEQWFGSERPRQFGPIFAAAQAGHPDAAQPLMAIALDGETTGIVRATALELLRPYGNSALQAMVAGLDDDDPLVRTSAVGGLDAGPEQLLTALVPRLLRDKIRSVRIEAARVLASTPPGQLTEADRAALEAATEEFVRAQLAQADMPSAHLNLGVHHTARGNVALAEAAYATAIRLDPFFLPSRFNLANLLNQLDRNEEAERILREGVRLHPDEGELHFSLALLLAEMGDQGGSLTAMRRAAILQPTRPRVHYNLGLLLKNTGESIEAESALLTAIQYDERNADALHALTLLYEEREEWQSAIPYAERLVELRPRDRIASELLARMRTRASH